MRASIKVTCREHGPFEPNAKDFLSTGCRECGYEKVADDCRALTTKEFVYGCKQVHDNFYDYSKTKYVNAHADITVICPVHGEFQQIARRHFEGMRCQKCSLAKQRRSGRSYIFVHGEHVCRSSWELDFIKKCEKRKIKVTSAENREHRIRYLDPVTQKERWYYPDFYLPQFDLIVEVKPKKLTGTKQNRAKFKAARRRGPFAVVTEFELNDFKSFVTTIKEQ